MPGDYSEELIEQLTAELDNWVDRCGGHIKLNNDLLAQHLAAWLSSAGRLVPEGWRRDTEWAVEESGTTTWTSEPYYRREHAERERRRNQHVVSRPIVAGPWTPSEPAQEKR